MASHVVECVKAAAVNALAALLTSEYNLVSGAPDAVAFLIAELVSMRVFLERAPAAEAEDAQARAAAADSQARASAEEVRQLFSDVARGLDAYSMAVRADADDHGNGRKGFRAFVERCVRLPSVVWSRRCAAEEVLGLKARVVEAADRRKRYREHEVDRAPVDCRRRRIQGDVPVQEELPAAAKTFQLAARLEKVERELEEGRLREHEYWARALQLLQSTAEKLGVPLPPPPADAVAAGHLFPPGSSGSTAAAASGADASVRVNGPAYGGDEAGADITDHAVERAPDSPVMAPSVGSPVKE